MWTCPICGRDFKRKNQSHSCKSVNTVDEYITTYAKEDQEIIHELRSMIKDTATHAEEKISWNMPTYVQNGNIIHFAMQKNYIGLHVGASTVQAFKDELAHYPHEKGTIKLPKDQALPKMLIEKIVLYNIEKNLSK